MTFLGNKITIILSMVGALLACGGGGGGGNGSISGGDHGSEDQKYSISFSPSSINHTATTAKEAQVFNITGTLTGNLNISNMYVLIDMDLDVFKDPVYYQDTNSITAQIETHDELWGGAYTGNITVNVCSDLNCNTKLGASPYTIPYNIILPRSFSRYEPINYNDNIVVDYDRDFIAINTESGTPGETINYRTEFSSDLGSLVFPQEMKDIFQISNIGSDGFSLTTPILADGIYTYDYEIGFTNSDSTFPFTIYYMVGRDKGSNNQFIFFEDPITIDVLYGETTNGHSRYLITGEERDLLDYPEFDITYDQPEIGWVHSIRGSEGRLSVPVDSKNLSLGTYSATVTATTLYSQISGSAQIVLKVIDGFILEDPRPYPLSFDKYLDDRSEYIDVDNTQQAEGTWQASTDTPWIILEQNEGNFLTMEDRTNYADYNHLRYKVDPTAIADLTNDSSGVGVITFSSSDPRFPDTDFEVPYEKHFPEIKTMSINQVRAGEPFTLDITGGHLDEMYAFGLEVHLRRVESGFLTETPFTVNDDTITTTSATLQHPGITSTGTYELVFNHNANIRADYEIYFVPRPTITVTE